jgi:site-specific DNA recombinase
MKRLIRHAEEKEIDLVLVYKLDRLGRKQKDVLHLLEDVFEKHNVAFKSATEPFDTSTPLGKAMIGILAVFAQLERDMIVERTTTGRRQKASQGIWYGGRIPFGYNWNQQTQTLEIVPEEAAIVKEIFKRYLQGQSRLAIAEWASSRTKARFFDHCVIRDMLARPIYMGKLVNAGTLVEGKHEPIIDEETWYAVQREYSRRKDGLSPLGDYLLTGLLECGVCGSGIVHVKRITHKRNKTYQYDLYACRNQHVRRKDRSDYCDLGYFRREKIEEWVVEEMKSVALKPKKINEFIKQKSRHTVDQNLVSSLETKLKAVVEGLENLYEAIQTGEIKASYVSGRIKKLEEEREAIERQLEDLKDEMPKIIEPRNMLYLVREVADAWDLLTEDEQKMMIRKVIKKVILKKDEDPEIVWNVVE